eukprot:scaffold2049_cov236-Chaetoceros_neogracile.AAC.1
MDTSKTNKLRQFTFFLAKDFHDSRHAYHSNLFSRLLKDIPFNLRRPSDDNNVKPQSDQVEYWLIH